jgi:hypothetical protein
MSATTTIPFSLIMEQERNGANGFEIVHAIAEFIDNAYDAGSTAFTLALLREPGCGPHATLIGYDTGSGAADLDALYSIGSSVVRKSSGRGLKNYGNRAAMGRLMADDILHISRIPTATRCSTLTFHLSALYAAVDATPTPRDYRAIDARINRTLFSRSTGGLTEEIRDKLTALHTQATDPALRTFLSGVLENRHPSYHLMMLEYTHFPPALEQEIADAFQSYRLSYYKALQEGRTMQYLRPDATLSLRFTPADAIDPLKNSPRLTGSLEFRGDTMAQFTVTAPGAAAPVQFWLTVAPTDRILHDGRTRRGPFRRTPPDAWTTSPVTGTVGFDCSVPNDAEEDRQVAAAGTLYRSRTDLRGVYLRFIDRILGRPLYSDDWTDVRNVGGLRVELTATDQATAETYFCVPAKKHSATYGNLHRVLQAVLNWIVNRVIIPKYSDYRMVTLPGQGVTDWRFEHFCRLLEDTGALATLPPVPPPVPVPPVPVPSPIPVPTPSQPPVPPPRPYHDLLSEFAEFATFLTEHSNLTDRLEDPRPPTTRQAEHVATVRQRLTDLRTMLSRIGIRHASVITLD